MRFLALLLTLALVPGCFISRTSINEPLDPSLVASLQPGTTTADQVLGLLGAPVEVVQLGHRSAYRFDASTTKQAGLWLVVVGFLNDDSRADRIWAFFDENDVLTHFGATFSAKKPEYAMPWQDIHDE